MIARLEVCNFWANGYYCACRLVTEGERFAYDDISVAEVVVVVKI